MIKTSYAAGEISALCARQVSLANQRLAQLVAAPPADVSAFTQFEQILADFSESVGPALFLRSVHPDAKLREEAVAAEQQVNMFSVDVWTRKDLYDALAAADVAQADTVQRRLAEHILRDYRRSGMALPEEERAQIKTLFERLSKLSTQFGANLDNNTDSIIVSAAELEGVPESLRTRLAPAVGGYRVTTKYSDVIPFMQNASNAEARRRLSDAFENREAATNTPLLQEALAVRRELAQRLGFATWAKFQLEPKMAKSPDAVWDFLTRLRAPLAKQRDADLARLLAYKRKEYPDAELHPWDLAYYENQVRKHELALDEEEIRQYFPAQKVVDELFAIYSTLLGVRFEEVPELAWAQNVELYAVRDAASGALVAHFYTDFYPRDGKYGHAAAFTLRAGRLVDGKYLTPIAAIVANFTPPSGETPSLLSHDEVETLFHEFGHIMHQTLTTAPYAAMSGTSVPGDFVELPSQMLENWVWDKTMLQRVSSHYATGKPLPDALIDKMIAAQRFNSGYFYTRQLLFSWYDMLLHTTDAEPISLYKKLYLEFTTLTPNPNTHFPANFGHLMGGYDAGYYGYLWSKVYAQDLFSVFKQRGLLDTATGRKYRELILAPGDTREQSETLREFLGREPNDAAFLELLLSG